MKFEQEFAELFEYAKNHFLSADGCHDFDHTLRVMKNAARLLEFHPEADAEAVRFSALLHDIGRVDETFCGKARSHAEKGAEMAEKLLEERHFSAEISSKIIDAIRCHRYRGKNKPQGIEAKIVFDADKLDSLGAVGIGRAFLFAGKLGARVHNTEQEAMNSDAYTKEDTAYREYLVKLRYIPEKMFTDEGKKMALERMDFMTNFFRELDREFF